MANELHVADVKVGDYLRELLWTDTKLWYVVDVTPKTVKIVPTKRCDDVPTMKDEPGDANIFPVVWYAVEPRADETPRVLRDGKYGLRFNKHTRAKLDTPVEWSDGEMRHFEVIDYRF